MTTSMTGFATGKGQGAGHGWTWDIRSVNGKGLDLRLRVPDWIDGLEALLRSELSRALQRGSVSLTLKVTQDGTDSAEMLGVNSAVLKSVLAALGQVEQEAMSQGITLRQATAADILLVRGVMDLSTPDIDLAPLRAAILADLPGVLAQFDVMRASEGLALQGIITAQLDQITSLLAEAATEAASRRNTAAATLRDALARVLTNADGVDENRLTQELALIAVRNDVTEEMDRLTAHVAAARTLLAEPGQVGRKFDFLMQEFMREANTLCSKSQSRTLTRVGLDLKTTIDQMREQIQNVE
ncbi:MAG: YicC family protein [Pseudorhodobacter sp.]|nr:YicC family protein [Pseudorhodobacter sp.]